MEQHTAAAAAVAAAVPRQAQLFASKIFIPKKVKYLFRKNMFSFENVTFEKKVNYLFRKYNVFI